MIRRLLLVAVTMGVLCTAATGAVMAKDPPQANGTDVTAVISQPPNPDQKASFDRKLAHAATLAQNDKNATKGAVTTAVTVYGVVSTTPRNADTTYYCGPAAIQVVSDYSWSAYRRTSQAEFARQAGTTIKDGTGITAERNVLQNAINGSPKGWFYYAVVRPSNGDAFSHYLQADVIYDGMPLIFNLTP